MSSFVPTFCLPLGPINRALGPASARTERAGPAGDIDKINGELDGRKRALRSAVLCANRPDCGIKVRLFRRMEPALSMAVPSCTAAKNEGGPQKCSIK
jgi:hypothetical protein